MHAFGIKDDRRYGRGKFEIGLGSVVSHGTPNARLILDLDHQHRMDRVRALQVGDQCRERMYITCISAASVALPKGESENTGSPLGLRTSGKRCGSRLIQLGA